MTNKYGKSPLNPIKLCGTHQSICYLDSLLTSDYQPILYHRIHTTTIANSKPIDCYEIYKGDGNTEILFIDTYASEDSKELPEGYCFQSDSVKPIKISGVEIFNTMGVNYKLRKFPEDIFKK